LLHHPRTQPHVQSTNLPIPTFAQRYGDGDLDIWIVMSAARGSRNPMAKCYSRDDAVLIVDALNAAAEVS
jgi:hypothetical protein